VVAIDGPFGPLSYSEFVHHTRSALRLPDGAHDFPPRFVQRHGVEQALSWWIRDQPDAGVSPWAASHQDTS